MKIHIHTPKLKMVRSSVKTASFQIGKISSTIRHSGSGWGSLGSLMVKDNEKETQDKKTGDRKTSDRTSEAMRFLKPREKKFYQRLPARIRNKFLPKEKMPVRGPAIKNKGGMGSGSINMSSAGSFRTVTPSPTGTSVFGSTLGTGTATGAGAGSGVSTGAGAAVMTSSAAATTAASTSAATAGAATTASTAAATVTTAATTTVTTAATAATAAATSAATAGATAGAFAVAEGAKLSKKAAEKIQKALKDSVKIKKAKQAALEEQNKKTSSGKKKLAGAGGAIQEFIESFKQVAGMAVGSFLSSILSLLISVVALPIMLIAVVAVLLVSLILGTSGTGNTQIVAVAQAEARNWEENIGGYKYKNWYGMDSDWCAIFVSWCADQCGFIDSGLFVKSASVPVIRNYYESIGAFHRKGTYEPKPGDLIIYGATGGDHIGIVAEYDSTAKIITTIEGNTGASSTDTYHEGSRVREKQVSIAYGWIYGFCSPDYPMDVGELTGGTNTEQAFNYFIALGYTPEASAGIIGNLLQETGFDANGDMAIHTTGYDGAVGIAMWTYPSIRNGFLNYAQAQGEPWPQTGLKVQLDYLAMTMGQTGVWMFNSYSASHFPADANMTLEEFKHCKDIALAATSFCACYERPDYRLAMLDKRIQYAQTVYRRYAK